MRALFVGALAALVALPVGATDEPPSWKEVGASQNNIKQIALATMAHSDTFDGKMPTDISDKNGKPLLSWRVHILPFLEHEALYKQFKLDEAWDSDNNKKLIALLPKVYAPIRVKAQAGETFYQRFTGPDALFDAGRQPKFPASITDGTYNTIMVIEAGAPVVWTKPADLIYDSKKPLPKLGGMFDGNFNIGRCDGSALWVKKGFDEKTFRAAVTPAGGETFDWTDLYKK